MTNYFTPKEHQNLKTQKLPNRNQEQLNSTPSDFSMSVIIGYDSALQIINSKHLGKFEILKN